MTLKELIKLNKNCNNNIFVRESNGNYSKPLWSIHDVWDVKLPAEIENREVRHFQVSADINKKLWLHITVNFEH